MKPREDVLRREFHTADLAAIERDRLRQSFFEDLLVKTTNEAPAVNAIELEQAEFASAVQHGSTPRVTGQVGCEAVAVAELVLDAIDEHNWDGGNAGRQGPLATPASADLRWLAKPRSPQSGLGGLSPGDRHLPVVLHCAPHRHRLAVG